MKLVSCALGVLLPFLSLHAVMAEEDIAVESVAQAAPEVQTKATLEELWNTATQLERNGQYEAAVNTYTTILKAEPSSRKAAYQLAYGLEQTGKRTEAAAAYDAVIAKAPYDFWAGSALWSKAQLSNKIGRTDEVRACIQNLKAYFPESPNVAKSMLLEAQLERRDARAAETAIARDTEARRLLGQAGAADQDKNETLSIQLYDEIIKTYPDTPAALRAYDAKGHILVRDRQKDKAMQAIPAFQAIIDKAGATSPRSRIVENARMRIAAIHHSNGRRAEAMIAYVPLLDSPNPEIASAANVKYAGLSFELLQHDIMKNGTSIDGKTWDAMRAACLRVTGIPKAPPQLLVRAELMVVESYCWQKRYEEAVKAADDFLAKFDQAAYKQDVATIRFFAGEAAQNIEQYDKALEHFRWIVNAYQGQKEIWPGMDHLPRTYFNIWKTLRLAKDSQGSIRLAADELLTIFPDSDYAKYVQLTIR